MLYIDCFQLTKACLTAQWIVIRLKLHCKSFSFVLKQVLSLRATGPKRDTAERHLFGKKHRLCEGHTAGAGGLYPWQPDNLHDSFKHKHFDWCSYLVEKRSRRRGRKGQRGRAERSLQKRKRNERQEGRQKAWGASMSLHFPWTHVRDPLLPSVWWSVAGAMSSQPGESLHGSQHKSSECSEPSDFATFPPLAHVSKQLSTCSCLRAVRPDISIRDFGHVCKHEEMSLLG